MAQEIQLNSVSKALRKIRKQVAITRIHYAKENKTYYGFSLEIAYMDITREEAEELCKLLGVGCQDQGIQPCEDIDERMFNERNSMNYQKNIDGFSLMITDDNKATVQQDDEDSVTVQLASEAEAKQMVAEFEDPDGDSMHEPNAIFGKYPQLHGFRP